MELSDSEEEVPMTTSLDTTAEFSDLSSDDDEVKTRRRSTRVAMNKITKSMDTTSKEESSNDRLFASLFAETKKIDATKKRVAALQEERKRGEQSRLKELEELQKNRIELKKTMDEQKKQENSDQDNVFVEADTRFFVQQPKTNVFFGQVDSKAAGPSTQRFYQDINLGSISAQDRDLFQQFQDLLNCDNPIVNIQKLGTAIDSIRLETETISTIATWKLRLLFHVACLFPNTSLANKAYHSLQSLLVGRACDSQTLHHIEARSLFRPLKRQRRVERAQDADCPKSPPSWSPSLEEIQYVFYTYGAQVSDPYVTSSTSTFAASLSPSVFLPRDSSIDQAPQSVSYMFVCGCFTHFIDSLALFLEASPTNYSTSDLSVILQMLLRCLIDPNPQLQYQVPSLLNTISAVFRHEYEMDTSPSPVQVLACAVLSSDVCQDVQSKVRILEYLTWNCPLTKLTQRAAAITLLSELTVPNKSASLTNDGDGINYSETNDNSLVGCNNFPFDFQVKEIKAIVTLKAINRLLESNTRILPSPDVASQPRWFYTVVALVTLALPNTFQEFQNEVTEYRKLLATFDLIDQNIEYRNPRMLPLYDLLSACTAQLSICFPEHKMK